ncbi:MAG: 16S rRNA (adenine(1518)-N(6)/adenine(1519)-N(6))-dimethyltransferase RsmA [Phycisphaerae bacterium]
MQTLSEIRRLLKSAGVRPSRHRGQCFLVDKNLMGKLLETAEPDGEETVLEVGPGTGSLTEELLQRAGRVVAVELDRGLADLLRRRFSGAENLLVIHRDVLEGKHAISPEVLDALGGRASLVSNLPYGIATPLIAELLRCSWRSVGGSREDCLLERMTFTVQKEVADRLSAGPGGGDYGPVSVLVRLLGEVRPGRLVPATAFWPRPEVDGQIVRIDFRSDKAREVTDIDVLGDVLHACFSHRRKQLSSLLRQRLARPDPQQLRRAVEQAGLDTTLRAAEITPEQYRAIGNALAGGVL